MQIDGHKMSDYARLKQQQQTAKQGRHQDKDTRSSLAVENRLTRQAISISGPVSVTDFSIQAILGTSIGNQQQSQQCQPQTKLKRPRPKKFQCPHCWVALSNSGQYRGHLRIHTGERPFKCDIPSCMKTFTRNEELTRHKRIHTGQRPYGCEQCGKRFGRKDHLKKHCKTHEKHAKKLSFIQSQIYDMKELGKMAEALSF